MNKRFRMKRRAWKLVFSAQRKLRLGEGQLFIDGRRVGNAQTIILGSPTGRINGVIPIRELQRIPRVNRNISVTCKVDINQSELDRILEGLKNIEPN